jgi:hypothetical protein
MREEDKGRYQVDDTPLCDIRKTIVHRLGLRCVFQEGTLDANQIYSIVLTSYEFDYHPHGVD